MLLRSGGIIDRYLRRAVVDGNGKRKQFARIPFSSAFTYETGSTDNALSAKGLKARDELPPLTKRQR